MNHRSLLFLETAMFLVFLGFGYWIGTSIGDEQATVAAINQLKPTPSPVPALPDGERILLLVGVDKLDSEQPQLESLWLLTYYLGEQPVQLLPIFPTAGEAERDVESQILDTFSVVKENGVTRLSPTFLQLLEENHYWLSGYILLDEHATAMIINLLGGLPTDQGLRSGDQIMRAIPTSVEQPSLAHHQQTILLGQACLMLSRLPSQPQWETVLELVPEHMITDIHPLNLLKEIQSVSANLYQLRCEFPSLAGAP